MLTTSHKVAVTVLSVAAILFSKTTIATINYSTAIANGKAAFLEQSGVNYRLSIIGARVNEMVTSVPIAPISVVLVGYKIYRDKAFSFTLPFDSKERFTIRLNSVEWGIHF